MLEKPPIADADINACLHAEYGLAASRVDFLPLGADVNTAVFRVTAASAPPRFLKLRQGSFDTAAVNLPRFLSDCGVAAIIPPLPTLSGRPWGRLAHWKTVLYPFVDGRNGYAARLTGAHWDQFAAALARIHAISPPPALKKRLRRETYAPDARELVRHALDAIERAVLDEPVARQVAALLQAERATIIALIMRAENLARTLRAAPRPQVICHADLHAGNLLLGVDGQLRIVDWDELLLAPKERDLMYVGAGLLASGLSPLAEEARFYRTYTRANVDTSAITYYRIERIIQDIAAFCEHLLFSSEGGADRAQWLRYLRSNFEPGGTIAIAMR